MGKVFLFVVPEWGEDPGNVTRRGLRCNYRLKKEVGQIPD